MKRSAIVFVLEPFYVHFDENHLISFEIFAYAIRGKYS